LIALPLGIAAAGASAADLTKEELASRLNGISVDDITDAPIPGMYEVAVGANVAYVTKDGRYIIRGDIIDVETSANVSEETRARARATMLGTVDPASMIVFKPANGAVKHTVTIFTDVDCGYCRQFHREIDKVTALGIEVHYLFYPRTGPNTESWAKADQVWCAADHNAALTRAKLGGELPGGPACTTPVETHYELGQRIGVRGTPAIFNEAGDLIGGYLPPATLAKVLDDPDALIDE
jgi:thiol:disulfide interchange protein DsbC